MKITNHSRALQGVRLPSGAAAFIRPGQSRQLELDEDGLRRAQRLPFLQIEGVVTPQETSDEENRAATIRAAIVTLEDGDFNSDGTPNLDKLNDAMPEGAARVTSDERDTVWDEMK